MASTSYYSKEGIEKLKEELNQLITFERPGISQQIAEARDKGDLSENAEYDAAKEAQSMLELKISKLQDLIMNARIIDETKLDQTKVLLFSIVKIKNLNNGSIMKYTIVPESEADLKSMKISVTSPISKGLLGKQIGEKVEVVVPAGVIPFEIIEITRI
ncbi:MAG: transcription elongation factor GreA [Bacteroidota bacterium]